jgi:protein-disulfide isomerase
MNNPNRAMRFGTQLLYGIAVVLVVVTIRDRLLARGGSSLRAASVAPQGAIDAGTFYTLATEGQRIGPPDAAVTVVVFSNYLCGHCAQFEATLSRLRERYPDHLTVVMKHFVPTRDRNQLSNQMGAECAADQGRFAEYNHLFFRMGQQLVVNDPWLQVADSIRIPDHDRFVGCVRSNKYALRVKRDTEEAKKLGVDGTPTSFINGRRAVGAVALDALDHFVASELGRGHRDR